MIPSKAFSHERYSGQTVRSPRSSWMWRVAVTVLNKIQHILDFLSSISTKGQVATAVRLSRHGMRFRPFFLSEWFMVLGVWEPYVRRRILLSRGDVFIDVGAHIGYFARLAARRVQAEGVVICVEPDPRNLPLLESNTSSYPQVVVVEGACGRKPGRMSFELDSNPLYSAKADGREGTTTVSVTTLDAVAADLLSTLKGPRRYTCKIDVEGAGLDVVLGGLSFLRSSRSDIILEITDEELSELTKLLPSYSIEPLARNYYYLHPSEEPPTDGAPTADLPVKETQ